MELAFRASAIRRSVLAIVVLWTGASCHADEPGAMKVEVLSESLDSPVALAVRPSQAGGHVEVCIAEKPSEKPTEQRERKGRIVRWDSASGELREVIAGPPAGLNGASVPSALEFLNAKTLIVVWADPKQRFAASAIYTLEESPEEGGAASLTTLRTAADEKLPDGAEAPTCLHRGERYLYALSGDGENVNVLRARHNSGMLGAFRRAAQLEGRAWRGVGTSPEGYLVAAGGGRVDFLDPSVSKAEPRLSIDCGLRGIQAISYAPLARPASRLLYAIEGPADATIEAADAPPDRHGLYRLDSALDGNDRAGCRASLIVPFEDPTAMAFGPDGTLYVTTGRQRAGEGRLLKITGEL